VGASGGLGDQIWVSVGPVGLICIGELQLKLINYIFFAINHRIAKCVAFSYDTNTICSYRSWDWGCVHKQFIQCISESRVLHFSEVGKAGPLVLVRFWLTHIDCRPSAAVRG